jgi:hypothetical protein
MTTESASRSTPTLISKVPTRPRSEPTIADMTNPTFQDLQRSPLM